MPSRMVPGYHAVTGGGGADVGDPLGTSATPGKSVPAKALGCEHTSMFEKWKIGRGWHTPG